MREHEKLRLEIIIDTITDRVISPEELKDISGVFIRAARKYFQGEPPYKLGYLEYFGDGQSRINYDEKR